MHVVKCRSEQQMAHQKAFMYIRSRIRQGCVLSPWQWCFKDTTVSWGRWHRRGGGIHIEYATFVQMEVCSLIRISTRQPPYGVSKMVEEMESITMCILKWKERWCWDWRMVYTASADVEVEGISKPQSASHYKLCAFHTMVTLTFLYDAEMTQPVTQQDTKKQQIDLLHEMPLRYTGVTLWRNADILTWLLKLENCQLKKSYIQEWLQQKGGPYLRCTLLMLSTKISPNRPLARSDKELWYAGWTLMDCS